MRGLFLTDRDFAVSLFGRSRLRPAAWRMLLASVLFGAHFTLAQAASATDADFLRDVRPILSGHCFKCHGPDQDARKANLRLDIREEAIKPAKSGEIAIVPSQPDKSELVRRIFTSDTDDVMPPPSVKNPLTEHEKEILKRWIASGAEYKPHWAFVKPAEHALPAVQNVEWPRNPIDFFVLARLEKEGLKPTEPAGRYALVRRLYLDLIGLPPTPEEADQFVNDSSPDAYERLVDTLLASPHYGERWARRWLDLARYADTNGYEKDRPRSIWLWRDWVINALNKDMPFDKFTIEQLAGDMLPHATQDQIIATGFNRNSMINEEGGTDPLEFRFYSMVDRVHVTATTWLGLTMACAQCHTHKFDPIQHTEYYQFMAFMDNCDEPVLSLSRPDLVEKQQSIQDKIRKLEAALVNEFPAETNIEWLTPAAEFTSENGAEAERLTDGSFRVNGKNPDKDTYTVTFETSLPRVTHLQLEAIPDDKVGKGGPGRTDHGNFVLSEIEMETQAKDGDGKTEKIKFSHAEADFSQDKFPVAHAIDGKADTGWAVGTEADRRFHRQAILTLAEPLQLAKPTKVTIRLSQQFGSRHTLGRFRLSLGSELPDARPAEERQRDHRDRAFAKWLKREAPKAVAWQRLRPAEARSQAPVLDVESDDSVFASGDFTKSDTYTLKFRNLPAGVKAIRIEAIPDDRLPGRGPGRVYYEGESGDFFLSNLKVLAEGKTLSLKNPTESYANEKDTAAKAIDDDLQSGWSIRGGQGRSHNAVFQLAEPLGQTNELQLEMTFERYYASALGRFRIWATTEDNATASPVSNDIYDILVKHRGEPGIQSLTRSNAESMPDRDKLLAYFVTVAPELAEARRNIDKLRSDMPKPPTTLVMRERAAEHPRVTNRHHRGEFLQPKETVTPGVPSFLPPLPAKAPQNRLGFAEWLVSPENPLTARVVMNRHWEAFFGRGIVRTIEDFGFQGDLPSHPELLDWLALEFMKQGWSQKKMHKLIVMSATYQQSAAVTPELLERDPQNILLSRGARFRMEAEMLRDTALVASGLFSEKVGGPSVYPPQPPSVTTEGAYGQLKWTVSEGADRYRRGLYTFAKRTAPYAMTATFDGPSGEACLARRDRSNTPLQALTLLNDTVFTECARALGRSAVAVDGTTAARVETLVRRCLTRPASKEERDKIVHFYETQLARYANGELKAAEILGTEEGDHLNERAAWTAVARVLLNLDESITKG